MAKNIQSCEEMTIDIGEYFKVFLKQIKTFFTVFFLIIAILSLNVLLAPKIYRTTTMIQPPVIGESLTGANDIESAEKLKGLIISNFFNEQLSGKLKLDLDKDVSKFTVVIPDKTNVLQVSVDLDSKTKEFGVTLLKGLSDVISDSYVKRIEAEITEIDNRIKQNERAIANVQETVKNSHDQIKEIIERENKLREEIKVINTYTAQILNNRGELLKNNQTIENTSTLLLAIYLQNNSSYLNQVNNQFTELSIRKGDLDLEIKKNLSQISDFQMAADKLKERKLFISNLKIIAQPRILVSPVSPGKNKKFILAIFSSLISAIMAVFLKEFLEKKVFIKNNG